MTRAELASILAERPGITDPDGAPLITREQYGLSEAETRRRQAWGQKFALRIDIKKALAAAREKVGSDRLWFCEFDATGHLEQVEARPERWGDAVIVRKDIPASYHLAVVVDDARQGITHVTRGRDLFAATDIHRLLQTLLGLPEPLYHHHRLITDASGRKLSKSARDTSLRVLRAAGTTPSDIRRLVGL